MISRLFFAALLLTAACLSFAPRARAVADTHGPVLSEPAVRRVEGPRSLTALVGPRSLTRDTNGDGLADVVAARVIVAAAATIADIEAATNIAARLGYETTALTLPLVVRDDNVAQPASIALPILVGRGNRVVQRLVADRVVDISTLKPGQGLIAAVASPLGGGDGLVVAGGDDEGTLNAGVELAARLPRVWGMNGIALPAIEEQAVRYLRAHGVTAADAAIQSLLVDSDRRGIARVTMRVQVGDGDGARAVKLFEDLERAHRQGQEPKTLNFTNVATTAIDVVAGAKSVAHADVSRPGLNQRTLTPPTDPDELAPDPPGDRGRPAEAAAGGSAPGRAFDLTNVFSIDGWYGDAYTDLIPDRTETAIVLGGSDSLGAAHIAARLGLETTGITLPLTRLAEKVRAPEREPSPILVGRSNALVERLVKLGRARLDDLQPGEGVVQIVPKAFGNATATVVAGADSAGTEAAASYLGRRVPYVWDNARGSMSLADVALQTNRFLQARSAAGQASMADAELDAIAAEVRDKTLESIDVKLFVEKADPALDKYVAERLRRAGVAAPVKATSVGITDPVTVFDDTLQVPWEVDDFWTMFKSDVLPKVKRGSKVDLEVRLSEAPELRRGIVEQARAQLIAAGAADPAVRV